MASDIKIQEQTAELEAARNKVCEGVGGGQEHR
jgi:hypothetical protein